MTTFPYQPLAWLAFSLISCNGCGNPTPAGRIPISGKVTLDGSPIDAGTIEFSPITGKLGSGGKITAGEFRLPQEKGLPPGEYIVRITSPSIPQPSASATGNVPGMAADDVHLGKERVPPRYNSKSELKIVVPAEAAAVRQEFSVTSR